MVHKEKEIMKNKKVLILLTVFLVVLIGVYFVITAVSKDDNENRRETTVDTSVKLLEMDSFDIEEMHVINKYGDKTYIRDENNTWRVKGDESADISQSLINRMATNGGALTALARIEDTCDNLSKYGLDNPQYTVTLKKYDGEASTFYIGMQNQVTTEYYMYLDGVAGIYTVSSNYPGFFNLNAKDLYYFIDITTTTGVSYFEEINMEYGDNSWKLVKDSEGNKYDVSGMRAWYLSGVYEEVVAADTSVLHDILEALTQIGLYSCEVFSATEEALEKAGLADGKCKGSLYYYFEEDEEDSEGNLTGNVIIGEEKIWIGNKTEDGAYYYVRPDGRDGIYTMNATYLDTIFNVSAENLLQKYVSLINISTVSSYHIEYQDIDYEAEVIGKKSGDATEYLHYHNGKELVGGSQFYVSLVGIYAEKALLEKEQPSGEELLKITFNRNTDVIPVYEVTFYEYSVNYYKVAVNGEVSYLINARDYKSLVETITSFVQNISYAE